MSFEACGCEAPFVGLSVADQCSGDQYLGFMSLVDLLIRYACNISDPCNRVVPKTQPAEEYDFIVIGGGSGGATIAGRLAEVSGWTTLLLEAGTDEPPAAQVPALPAFTKTILDWNFTAEQQTGACLSSDGYCSWSAGRVLGGTGVLNGMVYVRGTPADFDKWVEAGNTEWSYEKVLEYFKKSEGNPQVGSVVSDEYHGTEGPVSIQQFPDYIPLADDILEAAEQAGFPVVSDLNGADLVGFSRIQAYNRNGVRMSLARAFVRPHKDDAHFHVMLNSTATRIVLSGEGEEKKATAVEFVYEGKTYTVKAKKEIIVAAGAVQTPHLLLLSGIGPEDELEAAGVEPVHNLQGVGKGLSNHVSFGLYVSLNVPNLVDLNAAILDEYLTNQTGHLSGNGVSQLAARLASEYADPDDPDLSLYLDSWRNICAYSAEPGLPVNPEAPAETRKLWISITLLHPKSTGYVGLASNNPSDPPRIVGNYLSDPDDVKVITSGIRLVQKFIEAPLLKEKYNASQIWLDYGSCSQEFEVDSDEFWECAIRYQTHIVGHQCATCTMGPDPESGACVNQKLQVHGISNLRIADASAMVPRISGNTQAIVVAIAERANQFIREMYLDQED